MMEAARSVFRVMYACVFQRILASGAKATLCPPSWFRRPVPEFTVWNDQALPVWVRVEIWFVNTWF